MNIMKLRSIAVLTAIFFVAGSLSAADAKANWDKQCAKCHGPDGKGQTTMGKKLKVKDYTDPEFQKKLKDDEAVKIITEGKKDGDKVLMKAYKTELSEPEVKDLVVFVRKFAKK